MKVRKGLSLLLGLLLCLCALPATAHAAAPTESWSYSAATSFAGGTGTKDDPYQIATAEQLAKLAVDINTGTGTARAGEYFAVTADINLSGKLWEPIGRMDPGTGWYLGFYDYFDGGNHTISGMYVDTRGKTSAGGLFGCVQAHSTEATIKNLTVEGEVHAGGAIDQSDDPSDYSASGILVGDIKTSAAVSYALVENCHVSGTVVSEADSVGGMVGSASRLHISNSTANVSVSGQGMVGGFVGYGYIGEYSNCTSSGDVDGTWCVGGFAGQLFGESYGSDSNYVSIDHCLASGNVTASDWGAGGFVGYVSDTRISNSVALGDVHSTPTTASPRAGGFAGEIYSAGDCPVTITDSHAAGAATAAHSAIPAGGFVGYLYQGTITGCSYDAAKPLRLSSQRPRPPERSP